MPMIPPLGASVEIFHFACGKAIDNSLFQQAQKRFDRELYPHVRELVRDQVEYELVRDSLLDAVPFQAETWLNEEFPDGLPAANKQLIYLGERCEQFFCDLAEIGKDLKSLFIEALDFLNGLGD